MDLIKIINIFNIDNNTILKKIKKEKRKLIYNIDISSSSNNHQYLNYLL